MENFKNYDLWRLQSPDDELEEAARKRQLIAAKEDMADEMRDREKDRKAEENWRKDDEFYRKSGAD